MQKRVNIIANTPVTDLKIPIRGSVRNIVMDVEDIRKCLFRKAKVEEVISDDVTVKLDFTNYNQDNGAMLAQEAMPEINTVEEKPVDVEEVNETIEEIEDPVVSEEEAKEEVNSKKKKKK